VEELLRRHGISGVVQCRRGWGTEMSEQLILHVDMHAAPLEALPALLAPYPSHLMALSGRPWAWGSSWMQTGEGRVP